MRIGFFLTLFLSLLNMTYAQGQKKDEEKAESNLIMSHAFLYSGELEEAEKLLKEASTLTSSATIHYQYALVLLQLKKNEQAISELEKAHKAASNNQAFAYALAENLIDQSNLESAITLLNQYRPDPTSWRLTMEILDRAPQSYQKIKAFKLKELAESEVTLVQYLAFTDLLQKHQIDATEAYQKLIAHFGFSKPLLKNYLTYLLNEGKADLLAETLTAQKLLNSTEKSLFRLKSRLLTDPAVHKSDLQPLLGPQAETSQQAQFQLIHHLLQKGHIPDSSTRPILVAAASQGLPKTTPPALYKTKAEVLFALAEYKKSAQAFTEVPDEAMTDIDSWLHFLESLHRQSDLTLYKKYAEEALEFYPFQTFPYLHLGRANYLDGDLMAANAILKTGMKFAKTNEDKARLLLMISHVKKAEDIPLADITELDEVQAIIDNSSAKEPMVTELKGDWHFTKNATTEAKAAWTTALGQASDLLVINRIVFKLQQLDHK